MSGARTRARPPPLSRRRSLACTERAACRPVCHGRRCCVCFNDAQAPGLCALTSLSHKAPAAWPHATTAAPHAASAAR